MVEEVADSLTLTTMGIDSLCGENGCGYIIDDNSIESSLLEDLLSECMKIICSKNDNNNTSLPLGNFLSTQNEDIIGDKYMRKARYGRDLLESDTTIRGDYTVWLTPDLSKEFNFTAIPIFIKRMIKRMKPLKSLLSLNNDYSVQLGVYPGNGARYFKHLDAGNQKRLDGESIRKVTSILYLNKTTNGGKLRIYPCNIPEFHIDGWSDNNCNNGNNITYKDIDPIFGRLVCFRSDLIEHEVLPTYSTRIAITVWASGIVNRSNMKINESLTSNLVSDSIVTLNQENDHHNPLLLIPNESLESNTIQRFINTGTIFVSIAAYRDSECIHTINHLFTMATQRSRIFVGILWQCDRENDGECVDYNYLEGIGVSSNQIRVLEMRYDLATGPCWARHIISSLWRGERYILQIDSHMRFRMNWDCYLIHSLESIRGTTEFQKPILTTYPLGYEQPNSIPNDIRPTLLVPQRFDEDGILRQSAKLVEKTNIPSPIKSPLWASGFSFSDSSVIQDVPYDPQLPFLFFGEEISMSSRLYTHGYDFFSPTEAVVYHLWKRSYRPVFQEIKVENRETMRIESVNRVLCLLQMNSLSIEMGIYSLGNRRLLSDFENRIGVSFQKRELLPGSTEAKFLHPPGSIPFVTSDFSELITQTLNIKESRNSKSTMDSNKLSQVLKKVQEFL